MRWAKSLMVIGLAAFSFAAYAAEFKAGDIVVVDPWARASAAVSGASGVFLTIRNDGDQPDRLVGASASAAGKADLHKTVAEGDVMKMVEIPSVDIPAHGTAMLKPGGFHIMLMDLKMPLHAEASLPMTLKFERAGAIAVTVPVMAMGAKGPMGHMMHDPVQK